MKKYTSGRADDDSHPADTISRSEWQRDRYDGALLLCPVQPSTTINTDNSPAPTQRLAG